MKTIQFRFFLLAIIMVVLTSCASVNKTKMVPDSIVADLTPAFESGDFISRVDGVVVLMDASSSMSETYKDYVKFDIAKAFVRRMNETMPPIPAVSGLRTFGHSIKLTREKTKLFYGMAPYDRQGLNEGIDAVTSSGGTTPMAEATKKAGDDLKNIKGEKALIIISDAKDLDDKPVIEALNLVTTMDDRFCIYTVVVGDDENGKIIMDRIADVSSCGFMTMAQNFDNAPIMADYVSDVFLSRVERVVITEETGLGYSKPEPFMPNLGLVHFEFDSAKLTKEGETILDEHIEILGQNPGVKISVGGHTSAMGTEDYNYDLSEKRAASVKDYLITKGNIPSQKLTTIGYGETKPLVIEPNPERINSKEAKANMRVVFEVIEE
jgi:OOP family OmpA-OmpF porin